MLFIPLEVKLVVSKRSHWVTIVAQMRILGDEIGVGKCGPGERDELILCSRESRKSLIQ